MVDLTILQPISWFAASIGVCVAALYYVLNLRITQKNQELSLKAQQQTLETRQAQLFMHFATGMTSDQMMKHFLTVIYADTDNLNSFTKWYGEEGSENQISWGIIMNYFENAGVLVRKNLMDIDMVAVGFAGITRRFWEKMSPIIFEQRKTWSQPRLASEFEFLYGRLMRYMEEHPEFKT